jgi:hypothetical protein
MAEFGTAAQHPLGAVFVDELSSLRFPAGSMAPKVEAVCDFVRVAGARAAIGALQDLQAIFEGTAGTQVRRPEAPGTRTESPQLEWTSLTERTAPCHRASASAAVATTRPAFQPGALPPDGGAIDRVS